MTKRDFEKKFKGTNINFVGNRIIVELKESVESFENISFNRVIRCFEKYYNNETFKLSYTESF